jgi:DNA-binding NtrC family response regulator
MGKFNVRGRMTQSGSSKTLGASSSLNGLGVLIVEDSWQVGATLKRALEAWGANVAGPAATVADAARLISERTIDVALVDINLRGGEQSYGLIDQLHDRGIRVIVVTACANVPLAQGKVAGVLQKPVQPHVLLKSLQLPNLNHPTSRSLSSIRDP